MKLPPNIEKKLRQIQREEGLSEVEIIMLDAFMRNLAKMVRRERLRKETKMRAAA